MKQSGTSRRARMYSQYQVPGYVLIPGIPDRSWCVYVYTNMKCEEYTWYINKTMASWCVDEDPKHSCE